MADVLEVRNIEKYYGNKGNLTKAIDNISFKIEKGEFVGIMGASGSGKSTLLNCISTIDRVTAGSIKVNGEEITNLKGNKLNKFRREELGFIFQDFNLLDTLSCYENIALALTIQKVPAYSKGTSKRNTKTSKRSFRKIRYYRYIKKISISSFWWTKAKSSFSKSNNNKS